MCSIIFSNACKMFSNSTYRSMTKDTNFTLKNCRMSAAWPSGSERRRFTTTMIARLMVRQFYGPFFGCYRFQYNKVSLLANLLFHHFGGPFFSSLCGGRGLNFGTGQGLSVAWPSGLERRRFTTTMIARLMVQLPPKRRCCDLG